MSEPGRYTIDFDGCGWAVVAVLLLLFIYSDDVVKIIKAWKGLP